MTPIEKDQIIERELAQVKEELTAVDGLPGDVERVLCCLHDHLFDEVYNVNAIVACSGVSDTSIHARFRYHIGTTIHRYLENQRMKAATLLLQHDELEIFVITFSIGYMNLRTFERAFRRCVGCTPTGYREKMSKENV